MPFKYADRVRETSTSTGTGTFALDGAVTGFQTFSSGIGANNTCFYVISHRSSSEYEVGFGTVGSPATTLARTSIIASSNSNSSVNFSAGTKDVFVSVPADQVADSNFIPGGRLSLSSTLAVPSSDLSAQGTLYYVPYENSKIKIYTGNRWVTYDIGAGISLSLTGLAANQNYDVYAIASGGAVALTTTAWTNDTARATALSTVDGVPVQLGDTTLRFLGTIRTTSVGQSSDTQTQRFIWNFYNRVPKPLSIKETTASWTYTSTSWRYARGQTTNRVEFVVGYPDSFLALHLHTEVTHSSAGSGGMCALSYDDNSTYRSPPYGSNIVAVSRVSSASQRAYGRSAISGYAGIGYHYVAWLEALLGTGTVTFFGADSAGLQGFLVC